MPLITLMNAHAAWGDLPLLDDADLSIEPGERVGLIGRNGTGKSTLLSILAGHTHLDDGELRVQDGLRVLYVEQEPVLPEAANVKESLILRGKLDKIEDEREHWRRLAKLDECLMKFELDPERSVARVSGGGSGARLCPRARSSASRRADEPSGHRRHHDARKPRQRGIPHPALACRHHSRPSVPRQRLEPHHRA